MRAKKKNIIVFMAFLSIFFSTKFESTCIKAVKAEEIKSVQSDVVIETVDGIAKVGDGPAVILVKGQKEQIIQGKKYHLYELLHAQNAKYGESINYTINPIYEHALKQVVANELAKKGEKIQASELTEYKVIDYIKKLEHSVVEQETEENIQGPCSEFRFFVEEIRNQISREEIKVQEIYVTSVKPEGSFEIKGLKHGYYLLDEITNVEGTDTAASLCMVGTASPNATIHTKLDYPYVTKKIKEDDKVSNPTIKDPDGWNDIGDYEIGQNIWYKFDSQLPNINGYEQYYYAWHDKMDPMLTLDQQSIEVHIQGKDQNNNEKTYILSENEVAVDIMADGEESFSVSVSDIKKIVDREFPSQNSKKEYPYGQKVTVYFSARINENIAQLQEMKAMENDVRLEFSNDPDRIHSGSTGFTSWDTVVCYTYMIDLKKTNEKQQFLEGATFRLYNDPKCKQEIYVKKGKMGYVLMHADSIQHKRPQEAIEMRTDEQGAIRIIGIDSGTYYLKEVTAPPGYRVLKEPIEIQVKSTFAEDRDSYVKGDAKAGRTLKKLEATAKITSFYDGKTKEEKQELNTDPTIGKINLTVINQSGKKLPVTGNSVTALMILLGSGLMSYAIIRKSKKKKK